MNEGEERMMKLLASFRLRNQLSRKLASWLGGVGGPVLQASVRASLFLRLLVMLDYS